jgi:hypothetical protein
MHRDEVTYLCELGSWCYQEGLLDAEMMEQWLLSKLDESAVVDKQQQQTKTLKYGGAWSISSSSSSSWFLESYFASPITLSKATLHRVQQAISDFIERKCKCNTEILQSVLQFSVSESNFTTVLPRFLAGIQKKNLRNVLTVNNTFDLANFNSGICYLLLCKISRLMNCLQM